MKHTSIFRYNGTIAIAAVLALLPFATSSSATETARYKMDLPTPLVNSAAGQTFYQPNMVDPGGSASPTHLPIGGAMFSGAYQFNGVDDYLTFFNPPGYLFLNSDNLDWTLSFWIKTTDTGAGTPYAGTPKVPVLGNIGNNVGFGIGIDGGKATYKRYNAGWQTAQGATNVADGLAHYVTFVAVGSSNLNIYVDGQIDTLNLSVPPASSYPQFGVDVGRSYLAGGSTATYGAFTLDELRVWDTALSQSQIHDLIIPEPTSLALLGLGGLLLLRGRRRGVME